MTNVRHETEQVCEYNTATNFFKHIIFFSKITDLEQKRRVENIICMVEAR